MALNASGPISLAGTTAGQSIEVELNGNGTTQISLNDTAVRTLANVPSGAITMPTNFWGKSNNIYWAIYRGVTSANPPVGSYSTPNYRCAIANASGRVAHFFDYRESTNVNTSGLWFTKNDGSTIATYKTTNSGTASAIPVNGMVNYSATVIPYLTSGSTLGGITVTDSGATTSKLVTTSINGVGVDYITVAVGSDDRLYAYFVGQSKSSQYTTMAKVTLTDPPTWVAYRNPYSRNNTNYPKYVTLRTDNSYLYGQPNPTNGDIIFNSTTSNYSGRYTNATDVSRSPMGLYTDSSNNIYTALSDGTYAYVRKYNTSFVNSVAMRYNKAGTSLYGYPFMLGFGDYLYLFGDTYTTGNIQIVALNISDLTVAWGLQIVGPAGFSLGSQGPQYSTGTATQYGLFFSVTNSTASPIPTYDFKIPLNGQLSNPIVVNGTTFTPSTLSVTAVSQTLVNATDAGQGTAGASIPATTTAATALFSLSTPSAFKVTTGWT